MYTHCDQESMRHHHTNAHVCTDLTGDTDYANADKNDNLTSFSVYAKLCGEKKEKKNV